MKKNEFLYLIRKDLDLAQLEQAQTAADAVLKTLRERLTEGQAAHIEAHLPKEMRAVWSRGLTDRLVAMWHGPEKMSKREFLSRVRSRSRLVDEAKTEELTQGVFRALKKQLPERAADNVCAQLPRDLKDLWRAA